MPKNQQQRQKKRMKKRRKDKERRQKAKSNDQLSVQNLLKSARKFPIDQCLINRDWREGEELTRVVVARQLSERRLVVGTYLVDKLCLGVKDAHYLWDISRAEYQESILPQIYGPDEYVECPVELAHQVIYQAIDYAEQFKFKPHKDFKQAQYILDPRGTHPEEHEIEFGKDGKPFFVAGPYDNVKMVLKKLEKHAGEGNYEYFAPLDSLFVDPKQLQDDD